MPETHAFLCTTGAFFYRDKSWFLKLSEMLVQEVLYEAD
jgi:hypothetical protein